MDINSEQYRRATPEWQARYRMWNRRNRRRRAARTAIEFAWQVVERTSVTLAGYLVLRAAVVYLMHNGGLW